MLNRQLNKPLLTTPTLAKRTINIYQLLISYPSPLFEKLNLLCTNKLNPHVMSSLGIEPWPHWWEMSALTTAPSLPSFF